MKHLLVAPLARLAFRRAAPPVAVAVFAILASLAATNAGAPAEWLGDAPASAVASRGLARDAAWGALLMAAVPWLVWRSARAALTWRGRDAGWLRASGLEPTCAVASTWLGVVGAGALAAALAWTVGEAAARGSAPSWRRASALASPSGRWCTADAPLRWQVEIEPSTERARVACALELAAGGGAACEVELAARAAPGEARARAAIRERGSVEVDVPPGARSIDLELRALRAGDRAFVPADACSLWMATSSERAAGAALFVRTVVGFAALAALALGIATWTSAPTGALAALAVTVASMESPHLARWIAGADVFAALDDVARGRLPEAFELRGLIGAAAVIAAGLALARAGYARDGATR